jgi:SAM-dependent methyltransferase
LILTLDLLTTVRYNVSMLGAILTHVNGSISRQVCEVLEKCASKVPSSGAILDLNCGEGRSTIVLAQAVETKGRDVTVVAVDTHIRNPFSETPYQEGTTMNFLANIRKFRLAHRIVPIICSTDMVGRVVGKKCANLVVVQSPATAHSVYSQDALSQAIEVAKEAVRKNGFIAVLCPNSAYQTEFDSLISGHFPDDPGQVLNWPELKIYEIS